MAETHYLQIKIFTLSLLPAFTSEWGLFVWIRTMTSWNSNSFLCVLWASACGPVIALLVSNTQWGKQGYVSRLFNSSGRHTALSYSRCFARPFPVAWFGCLGRIFYGSCSCFFKSLLVRPVWSWAVFSTRLLRTEVQWRPHLWSYIHQSRRIQFL